MSDHSAVRRTTSAAHIDEQTGEPICQPFKTLEDIAAFSLSSGVDEVCRASVPLPVTASLHPPGKPPHPRTIVCHDMAGGYLEDRFVQGVVDKDAYRFYHWAAIDQFIYFSHYFVTIPPPGWTNAAHRHGVPMLGTIITEWDEGKQRCQEFLSEPTNYITLAQNLAKIAHYYRFDGWLINIENPIEAEKVPSLVDFVKILTEETHKLVPHSTVLWYDSVIHTGELKWQNELNVLNRCFFEVCDGMFLNYTWKEGSLERTLQCVGETGRSVYDVYVGIDVFGRGCKGGGGFNTKEALEAVRAHFLSAAIFAQGWMWEKFEKDDFSAHENRFWALLEPYLTHHTIQSLPLCTNFCQGWGRKMFKQGKVVLDKKWSSLGLGETQPSWQVVEEIDPSDRGSDESLGRCLPYYYHTQEGYSGGGCLRLTRPGLYKLMDTEIVLPAKAIISFTSKLKEGSNLHLTIKTSDGAGTRHSNSDELSSHTFGSAGRDGGREVTDSAGWTTWEYLVSDLGGCVLREVGVQVELGPDCPLLGQIQVKNADESPDDLDGLVSVIQDLEGPGAQDCRDFQGGGPLTMTCTLMWTDIDQPSLNYYIVSSKFKNSDNNEEKVEYIGTTTAPMFRVYMLNGPPESQCVEFRVDAKLNCGQVIRVGKNITSWKK